MVERSPLVSTSKIGPTCRTRQRTRRTMTWPRSHAHCVGWGLEIALHADLVLASHDCTFFFPSVRNGAGLPDSTMAIYHLGIQWAKRLLLTGDAIDGRTAARIGLVVESFAENEL